MRVALIAAAGASREIGAGNKLLWSIPEDMNWFKQKTKNRVVVMGRKTYESIGKPLKGRLNVVLTHNMNFDPHPDVLVRHSLESILHEFMNEIEIMVIGGESIYKQFLPYANRIYLTEVEESFKEADAFFPEFDLSVWNRYFHQRGNDSSAFIYHFSVYKKVLKQEGEGLDG